MITLTKITDIDMKITYHIGDRKITYNTTAVPPIGATVELELDNDPLNHAVFKVIDVKFKLMLDDLPNVHEEVDIFLAIDATYTIEKVLLDEIYTSTSSR